MLAAIHQLHYLPWLRYLEKIARADVFVALDDVQYTKNGFQNRNKIKHAKGWMYLTVPVKAHSGQRLNEIEIADNNAWNVSHWRAIETNYRNAPYFSDYAEALGEIYTSPWNHLHPLNWKLLTFFRWALRIQTPLVLSSELNVPGQATERLVNICHKINADRYYSGSFAADSYLDDDILQAGGIELVLQEWKCPTYRQCFPQIGFVPDLSIVDLLFNEGPRSLEIILSDGKQGEVQPAGAVS